MGRGKFQSKAKPVPALTLLLLVLLAVAMSSVGVAAYLAKSSERDVVNTFTAAATPAPQVVSRDGRSCVDVGDPGYAVYVRAAVVPNWTHNGAILPVAPDTFTITPGENWFAHSDGFLYYKLPVSSGVTSPIYTGIGTTEKGNGSITVDIAVQVIQALGETDGPDAQTAVLNAWGIQPDN